MKAILVSATSPYVNILKRSLSLSNTEIISSYDSISGFQTHIDDPANKNFDVIIASDRLSDGTVVNLVDQLKQMNLIDKTVFIIEDASKDAINYFTSNRYSYVLQNDIMPQEFIEDLESGAIKIGRISAAEERKKQMDTIQSLSPASETTHQKPFTQPITQNTYPSTQPVTEPGKDLGRVDLFGKADILNPEPEPVVEETQTEDWTATMTSRFGQPNLDPNNTQNAYQQQQQRPAQTIQFKPIAVCVNSPKGGVGKTTLCLELASLLADRASSMDFNELGRLSHNSEIRVCLVDMNLSFDTMAATIESVYTSTHSSTVTDWFHMINRKILATIDNKSRMELTNNNYVGIEKYLDESQVTFDRSEVEKMIVVDKTTGLHILPSIALPQDAEYAHPQYLKLILQTLKKYYDILIIDTGNNISLFTQEAIKASDEVLIICSKSKGAASTVQKLLLFLKNLKPPISTENFNLVINNPNGKENVYTSASFSNVLKLPLVAEIPYDENVRLAHEEGEFYSINNRKTEYAKACTKLAQSICPLWEVIPNRNNRKKKKKPRSKKFLGLF